MTSRSFGGTGGAQGPFEEIDVDLDPKFLVDPVPTVGVVRALSTGEGIEQIELTGSRASGLARPQSDWDFKIATTAFPGHSILR